MSKADIPFISKKDLRIFIIKNKEKVCDKIAEKYIKAIQTIIDEPAQDITKKELNELFYLEKIGTNYCNFEIEDE